MFENRRSPGERAHSSVSECATGGLYVRRFRRRVVRNDGEVRRLAGSRSLGPTPADALSVAPASPSPATDEDGSRDSKKIRRLDSAQTGLIANDHVIQAFPPN